MSSADRCSRRPSRALKACHLGKQDRRQGEGEAEDDLSDEEWAELAVVGGDLNRAGGRIPDFAGDDEDLIQILRAKLAY